MRGKALDLKGQDIGYWRVGERCEAKRPGESYWRFKCTCRCGTKKEINAMSLLAKTTLSCGCKQRERWDANSRDIKGVQFHHLRAIEPVGKRTGLWRFECECGQIIEEPAWKIESEMKKSCGCFSDYEKRAPMAVGQRFDMLEAVAPVPGKVEYWSFRCDCGKEVEMNKSKVASKARQGKKLSCGCTEEQDKRQIGTIKHSGVPGVTWDAGVQRWHVRICFRGRRFDLGRRESLEEAIKIRKDAEMEFLGRHL